VRDVRASIFDTSGDGTRGACGSESRKVNDEAEGDVDATEAVERVVDAMDALRPRRGVMLEDGGVGVSMLVGTDGRGCIVAGFAAGLAAGGAGKARGPRSAETEPEPVEPSAGCYGLSETWVLAELGVGGVPRTTVRGHADGDGAGDALRRCLRCGRLLDSSAGVAQ
jgi:hypothetical protein